MNNLIVKFIAFTMLMGTAVLIFEDNDRYPFGYPLLGVTIPLSYLSLKHLYKRTLSD